MNRRLFKSLMVKSVALWIVPLLIARALIPAGFMLSAGAGGLELTFCSGTTLISAAHEGHQAAGQHGDHANGSHHGNGAGNEPAGSHDNVPCPYSLAASAVFADVPYLASAAIVPSDEVVDFISAPVRNAGPVRADRIRGPPIFS